MEFLPNSLGAGDPSNYCIGPPLYTTGMNHRVLVGWSKPLRPYKSVVSDLSFRNEERLRKSILPP